MARVRRSPQQWQQLIEEQQSSKLSVSQFCVEHNITVSNFYLQRKKYREQSAAQAESPDNWLPLNELMSVQQGERQWQIELCLPGGVVLNMLTDTGC